MTTTPDLYIDPAPGAWNLRSRLTQRLSLATGILIGIMLLSAVLNFANLNALGDGNLYYTAAVKSMLQSPSNFFFIAAEPGGSVTIDKPPLGLWLQAISAFFLGVNGFAVMLPQILAGIFSVPLVYHLVRRWFGSSAGLIAAFVLAVTPVAIAVQRNNTMDSTLVFTLLLAAWAFIKATEKGSLRWLLLGGVLVGLGFNIKMLQAFLPLPAFYALYFLGAKVGWGRKIAHLTATTMLLLAVSFSWAIVVDLTPADQRPYVGSSQTNSALELALGYNGIQRLLGRGNSLTSSSTSPTGTDGGAAAAGGSTTTTDGRRPDSTGAGVPIGTSEIGQPGVLRLFGQSLGNEIGWLLPFGLLSAILLAVSGWPRLPLNKTQQAAVLWGGWLLTEVVFFSAAGFFHAYYLVMLAPPLAALVGIGLMHLWKLRERFPHGASMVLVLSVAASVIVQCILVAQYQSAALWLIPIGLTLLVGAALLLLRGKTQRWAVIGFLCLIASLTAVPAIWSGLTTADASQSTALPHAYNGDQRGDFDVQGMVALMAQNGGQPPAGMNLPDDGNAVNGMTPPTGMNLPGSGFSEQVDETLLKYLELTTEGVRYLMAVSSSHEGDSYILATGRPVLLMGGFNGSDPVVDVDDLKALVTAGELRYILYGGRGGRGGAPGGNNSAISEWLQSDCQVVSEFSSEGGSSLYLCSG